MASSRYPEAWSKSAGLLCSAASWCRERWGFGLSFARLLLNLLGNIPDSLVGEGTVFEDVGFVVGTVLGLLVLTAGSSLLGVTLLRQRVGSRLGAWLLVLSLPGILLANFLGFGNIPSGPVLWYGLIWVCWDIRCGR